MYHQSLAALLLLVIVRNKTSSFYIGGALTAFSFSSSAFSCAAFIARFSSRFFFGGVAGVDNSVHPFGSGVDNGVIDSLAALVLSVWHEGSEVVNKLV